MNCNARKEIQRHFTWKNFAAGIKSSASTKIFCTGEYNEKFPRDESKQGAATHSDEYKVK